MFFIHLFSISCTIKPNFNSGPLSLTFPMVWFSMIAYSAIKEREVSALNEKLLSISNLCVYIYTNQFCNRAVDGVSFDLMKGRTLGIVGESGCGKSITALSIVKLLPAPARIESGEIRFMSKHGEIRLDSLPPKGKQMQSIRGEEIAMIFQDPASSLNPVYRIGYQITESLMAHRKLDRKEARRQSIRLLSEMGIPNSAKRADDYPFQFSGGMSQRAMIAMAMACTPSLLIADEPTTALDVTIQAQILSLMRKMQQEYNTAILLITHDIGVVAQMAHDIMVMYMGKMVEKGATADLLRTPRHPYTRALLHSIPILGETRGKSLHAIQGKPPNPQRLPIGCRFSPRCMYSTDICKIEPGVEQIDETSFVSCWNWKKVNA